DLAHAGGYLFHAGGVHGVEGVGLVEAYPAVVPLLQPERVAESGLDLKQASIEGIVQRAVVFGGGFAVQAQLDLHRAVVQPDLVMNAAVRRTIPELGEPAPR